MALAGILLIPGLATLWMAWEKLTVSVAPVPVPLSLASAGALTVNLVWAFMLARFRTHRGGTGDGLSVGLRVARSDCWAGDRSHEH
jgi:Co/Zn/Cd efflux system component